jgi:sodium-dependent dicarboxylate transporter 2/3/5
MSMWGELSDLKTTLTPAEYDREKIKKTIGLFGGPAVFLLILFVIPPPPELSIMAWRCVAVTSWTVIWWVLEPFALPTTSLLTLFLIPVLGILPPNEVYSNFGSLGVFMCIGAFILVHGVNVSGLGKRIALWALSREWVNSPWRLAIALSLVTMVISSVMPNIPVTILMMGIAISLLNNLEAPFRGGFTTLFLLSTAFPSVIGGMVTPIGATAPNFLLISITKEVLGATIPFSGWVLTCLPIAIILFIAMLFLFKLSYYRSEVEGLKDI